MVSIWRDRNGPQDLPCLFLFCLMSTGILLPGSAHGAMMDDGAQRLLKSGPPAQVNAAALAMMDDGAQRLLKGDDCLNEGSSAWGDSDDLARTHVVRKGETLYAIARANGMRVEALLALNGLTSEKVLFPGQSLQLPSAVGGAGVLTEAAPAEEAATAGEQREILTPSWVESSQPGVSEPRSDGSGVIGSGSTGSGATTGEPRAYVSAMAQAGAGEPGEYETRTDAPPMSTAEHPSKTSFPSRGALLSAMQAPLSGEITSPFGLRERGFHHGIDIAGETGATIRAVQAGKVVYAGWRPIYGKVVIIEHPFGVRTVYGHASRLLVRQGDNVARGTVIAEVGSTGVATGPHLHLELHIDRATVNPRAYIRGLSS